MNPNINPNPLLDNSELPNFNQIKPEHMIPAIEKRLSDARKSIQTSLSLPPSWENTVLLIEESDDLLGKTFSPIRHLHSVSNTEHIREAFDQILPMLTEYQTEVGQNINLFKAYETILHSPEFTNFSAIQKKVIQDGLRDFKLSGVHLPEKEKSRLAEIANLLSQLSTQFENNLLDATEKFIFKTDDVSKLQGLPESALLAAAQKAESLEHTGYALGLDFPTYHAVITYAENKELREIFYQAFTTRAPENSKIIDQILALRQEEAELLGFKNFGEFSLATKMADSPQMVLNFLDELAQKTRPFAEQDLENLKAFAKLTPTDVLNSWDVPFYSEKLRVAQYELSQEDLRAYFPASQVLKGLFELSETLFGISLSPSKKSISTWHPEVQFFDLINTPSGKIIGHIYLDLYARDKKREGAWMDECHERRRRQDGSLQNPVAYLTCNFLPPLKNPNNSNNSNQEAYLTHDDVVTTFHEFGHCLHHLLTQIETSALSGINGVPWDAVELPSQFLENFAWQWEVVSKISRHQETGESLPHNLFKKLLETKNFQSGLTMMRQLEFSIFDFELHCQSHQDSPPDVQKILDAVRVKYSLIPPPAYNKFQNTFSHIFAGGYGAGYYSYKWAEVLSSDAFSRFEEEGLFSPYIGKAFLDEILSVGGSRDPNDMFKAFRGREVSVDALLRHSGLA